jgi:serine/threonine protein kinase
MSEPDNNSGWQPLEQYIGGAFELGHFLKIAIFISEALAELHGRHHIHRKLSPNCIRLNITEKRAEIVPYSELNQLNSLQNMLAYMSPEQTGRMNRIVDCRSDLSLGVMLYQLLLKPPHNCRCP